MKYIQCFGGIGANIVDIPPERAAAATTAFQTYVPFDPVKHANFVPRDTVDGQGNLSSVYRGKAALADFLAVAIEQAKEVGDDTKTLEAQYAAATLDAELAKPAAAEVVEP